MEFFYILILIILYFINSQQYTPVYDIIGNISLFNIPITEDKYYETVIDSLIELMENYAFIKILKSPPKVNGSDYFNKVDIIQDLKNLKSTINETTPNFYEFYQDISKIIASSQDFHIIFTYIGQKAPFDMLGKLIISSPIEIFIKKDKKVLANLNSVIYKLNNETQVKNSDIISNYYKNKTYLTKINGKNVYQYLREFCADYCRYKSKNSKFIFNKVNFGGFYLWQCPLTFDELKEFSITYENGLTLSSNYIGFIKNSQNDNLKNTELSFNNFYNIKNKFFEEPIITSQEKENKVTWDINIDNHIKCKVDHKNEINVIFQNSFNPNPSDPLGIINNFSYCHGNFSNNDYPLIVIESLNGGGFAQLSKLMQQMVQDLMYPKNYYSVIHNKNTKQFLYDNKDSFIFVNDYETNNLTIDEFYNDIVSEKYGNITIERSKQKIAVDLNFESLIKNNIFKRNSTKKPTDIIIFTDGLSFSSTSVFIKNVYYFGGAILVGYSGDPEAELFDASQNPTFVLTNLTGIKGFIELIKRGFYFPRIPSGAMYRTKYDINNENIPEEFTVNLIDERINIYNDYSDDLYEDFISEAKIIFEKYKKSCNPNNKYLNFLNEDCSFAEGHLHGGYKCGDDGTWNKTCVPFYCDEEYYFEPNEKKCIPLKEIKRDSSDNSISFAFLFIVLGVIIVVLIIIIVYYKRKNKNELDLQEIKEELMQN